MVGSCPGESPLLEQVEQALHTSRATHTGSQAVARAHRDGREGHTPCSVPVSTAQKALHNTRTGS